MPDPILTPREHDVLRGLAEGASQEELAGILYVSVSTLKTFIRQVYDKLRARNAAHAVHIGWQRGLFGAVSTTPSTPVETRHG